MMFPISNPLNNNGLPWQQGSSSPLWTPAALGLDIWLSPDFGVTMSGAEVASWTSQTSTAHTFSQATSASRPTMRTVSGNAGLDFDGTDDSLVGPTIDAAFGGETPLGLAAIVYAEAWGAGTGVAASTTRAWFGNNDNVYLHFGVVGAAYGAALNYFNDLAGVSGMSCAMSLNTKTLVLASTDNATTVLVKAGASAEASNTGRAQNAVNGGYNLSVGRGMVSGTTAFDGVIFEILARRTVFTSAEKASIAAYAYRKYGAAV